MRALRFVYLIVGIFIATAAAFTVYASSLSLLEARASSQWPSVPGRITSTKMVITTGRYGSMAPDIRYTYSVGTSEFTGSRLEVVTYSATTSYASDALAEFREGSHVPVYFDPSRPERSVLRRGPNWVAYGLPAVSTIMIFFGAGLVRLASRLGRTQIRK